MVLPRARSLPVLDSASPWGNDPNEVNRSFYVEGLSKKLQEWPSDEAKDEAATITSSPHSEAFVPPLLASLGSLGHPEVCNRPCVYFQEGLCRNGSACSFCHLFHPEKNVKLDKRQRTLLQSFSYEEFLVYTLPFIKERLGEMNVHAPELLYLLETEAGNATSPLMPERDRRNMSKVFVRMNLSSLIGMVRQKGRQQNKFPDEEANSKPEIDVVMERIRENFIPKE